MVKNVKNDKVIRAISIGLATMLASTSMPVIAMANEAEPDGAAQESQLNEESSSQQQNESSATVESYTACEDASVTAVEAAQAITDATGAVTDMAGDTTELQQELGNAFSEVGETQENISDIADALQDAMIHEVKAEQKEETADASIAAFEEQNAAEKDMEKKIVENADKAIEDAETANTTNSKKEAVNAKDSAEQEFETAKAELEKSTQVYEAVSQAAQKAQSDYDAAKSERDQAAADLVKARQELEKANSNATAAQEYMKAAQSRVKALEEKTQKYAETKEQLESIENQYYGMLIQYYREILGAKETVYHDDGTLDIEANAKKLSQADINKKAASPGDTVMELGRDLARKLVTYQIMNDENVDWDSAEFVFGDQGKQTKKAREAIVFESGELTEEGNNKDQVVTNKDRKDKDGNTITHNDTYTFKWEQSSDKTDSGRTNRFHVQYKDKDGVVHDEYYNYIYKSGDFKDNLDLEKGQIYLARVEQNEDGTWHTTRVVDDNNFDDYKKLTDVLTAISDLEDYEKAVDAVNKAADEVNTLQQKISRLQITSTDTTKIDELKGRLDQALEDFSTALENKAMLEDKVEEARIAVESIDLSRFKVVPTADEDDDPVPGTPTATVAETEVTPALSMPAVTAMTTDAAGYITMPTITPAVTMDNGTPLTEVAGAFREAPTVKGNTKKAADKKIANLEDEVLPGAMTAPEQEQEKMSLWWLLIVALLGATGVAMYEKHKEKQKEKEAR